MPGELTSYYMQDHGDNETASEVFSAYFDSREALDESKDMTDLNNKADALIALGMARLSQNSLDERQRFERWVNLKRESVGKKLASALSKQESEGKIQ